MTPASGHAIIAVLLLLLGSRHPASADATLSLATGRMGASPYTAGVGLASLIKFQLLPTRGLDLRAIETEGALDNVHRLGAGKVDFAILPSVVGQVARAGTGSFAGEAPARNLRAITTLWRDAVHLVLRADEVSTGTIDDLAMLKGRRIFLGEPATGTVDASRLLLANLGIDADRAFKIARVPDGDGVAAIKRGDLDAFSATAKPPAAMFDDVFKATSPGMRLLDVTAAQMTRLNGSHWLWTPYVIRAATYPGQEADVRTVALSNLLVVRADVDADVVYAVTRSIFENLAYLQRVDPMLADLTLDDALSGMAMPLHPGALRYYQEAGLIPGAAAVDRAAPADGPEPGDPGVDDAAGWAEGTGGPLTAVSPFGQVPGRVPLRAGRRPATPVPPAQDEALWRQRATF